MRNILILGKYSSLETIKKLIKEVGDHCVQHTRIIVKEGDVAPECPLVVRHEKKMQGDVCDLLWEAAELDQELPLVVASTRGFLNYGKMMPIKSDVSLYIACSESSCASFKFDAKRTLCESAELPASVPYCIWFARTGDFTRSAERLIYQHKSEHDGRFELRTLINQFILEGNLIEVKSIVF